MPFETILFDLDDTLYQNDNGLWSAIRDRISIYMRERVGLSEELIPVLRHRYFESYGTTLRGLQYHHHVNADDYLAFVHDLPLEKYIHKDNELIEIIRSLPQRKYIFTNADANHAQRVMKILGIEPWMDGIIDVHAIEFACKPELHAYRKAIELAGVSSTSACLYLDDNLRNLEPASSLGIATVLVGTTLAHPSVWKSIPDIRSLCRYIPELWLPYSPRCVG